MPAPALRLLAALACLVALPSPSAEATEAELRRRTQENLDAIAPGRVEVRRRNAHERLVHVDENGIVRSEAEFLAELQPLPTGLVSTLVVDRLAVTDLGDTAAVTHEDLEALDYHSQTLRRRWRQTDTWLRTPEGWKLVAEQVLALQTDPPVRALSAKQLCGYNGAYRLPTRSAPLCAARATRCCLNAAVDRQRPTAPKSPTCSSRPSSRARGGSSSAMRRAASWASSTGAKAWISVRRGWSEYRANRATQ